MQCYVNVVARLCPVLCHSVACVRTLTCLPVDVSRLTIDCEQTASRLLPGWRRVAGSLRVHDDDVVRWVVDGGPWAMMAMCCDVVGVAVVDGDDDGDVNGGGGDNVLQSFARAWPAYCVAVARILQLRGLCSQYIMTTLPIY